MIIENIYTLKVETNLGTRYLVVAQAHNFMDTYLRTDKKIPFFNIRTDGVLNPYGFATLDEIRKFYNWNNLEANKMQENFRNRFSKKTSVYGNNSKSLTFYEICVMVTNSLKNPMTPEALFGHSPLLDISLNINRNIVKLNEVPLTVAAQKFQESPIGTTISNILFNTPLVTVKQRKEIEKPYYLINLNGNENRKRFGYFQSIKKGCLYFTDLKRQAKQFKSENEVYAYIEKYNDCFGKNGFEIIEIEGISIETGLNLKKISTL